MMTDYLSDASFEQEVLLSAGPVLVSFIGTECGPWRAMSWTLEQVAKVLQGQVKVVKLDVNHSPGLRAKYEIHGLPTLVVFHKGEPVARRVGAVAQTDELEAWIRAAIAS